MTAPSAPKTTEATTEAPKTTEAHKQRVWVVDEEYPVYETRCREKCRNCGGYMYSQSDIDNHPCYSQVASNWYTEYYDVQVGTETIHHDEVGHWEWQ